MHVNDLKIQDMGVR